MDIIINLLLAILIIGLFICVEVVLCCIKHCNELEQQYIEKNNDENINIS